MSLLLILLAALQAAADGAHWVTRHQLLTAAILVAAILTLPILYGIARALVAAVVTLTLVACAAVGELAVRGRPRRRP